MAPKRSPSPALNRSNGSCSGSSNSISISNNNSINNNNNGINNNGIHGTNASQLVPKNNGGALACKANGIVNGKRRVQKVDRTLNGRRNTDRTQPMQLLHIPKTPSGNCDGVRSVNSDSGTGSSASLSNAVDGNKQSTVIAHSNLIGKATSKPKGKYKCPPPNGKSTNRRKLLRRSCALRRFSALDSTEDRCRLSDEGPKYFGGPYSHIRRKLDYSYHANYQKERQWLQDAIIEDMLDNVEDPTVCVTPTEPWLLYTTGVKGAGKRHVVNELVKTDRLPLLSFVSIDQDEIRRRLPEYGSYVKRNPMLVENLTRKECGIIAEIVAMAAFQAGRNVVIDGTMSDPQWELRRIEGLRKQYPSVKVGLIHVVASYETVVRRCHTHAKVTGRHIPEESIQKKLEVISQAIDTLRPHLDAFYRIENEDSIELVSGEDWPEFRRTFLQTCAWIPGSNGSTKSKRQISVEQKQGAVENFSAIRRRRRSRRRFSALLSSEENNKSMDNNYYGKFSHIRETLDYNYHSNYTFERQKLQDAIISDMLESAIVTDVKGQLGTVPTEPWIVFTAGAMGAGKSYTMNKLVEKGRFPLIAFVIVDPDEIRHLLPEYHLYVEENPELAGELTRKEAGCIAEILTLAALQAGKNVLQDGSLRDAEWYKVYFARLRKDFPSLRQAILHVTAPREAVFQRAADRALVTGRVVPEYLLEKTMEQVPKSVKILAPLVDYYAELNNAPGAPDIELVKPEGATWESFISVWKQTVAYVPQGRKLVEITKKLESRTSGSMDSSRSR